MYGQMLIFENDSKRQVDVVSFISERSARSYLSEKGDLSIAQSKIFVIASNLTFPSTFPSIIYTSVRKED